MSRAETTASNGGSSFVGPSHTCRGRFRPAAMQHLVIGARSDAMDFERRYATSALDRTRALNDVMLGGQLSFLETFSPSADCRQQERRQEERRHGEQSGANRS